MSHQLILTEKKEFPQEVCFRTTTDQHGKSRRDLLIPNRYWLDLPHIWSTQTKADPVIGIGEIYFNECIRHISYSFKLELIKSNGDPINEYTIDFIGHSFLSRGDTFQKFLINFIKNYNNAIDTLNITLESLSLTTYNNYDVISTMNYYEENGEMVPKIVFDTTDNGNNEKWNSIKIGGGIAEAVTPKLTFTFRSDDSRIVLNGGLSSDIIISSLNILKLRPQWDRTNVYVKSSISSLTENQFLGYSRSNSSTRVKYYRVSNDTKRIWIELYSSRDIRARSILPEDELDFLMIEGVIYFDAKNFI